MKVLVTEKELQEGVGRLAKKISDQYRSKPLMILGVLQESIVLLADLMRRMGIPSQMRVVQPVCDHVGPDKPRQLCVDNSISEAVPHHHVLIVDDVFASGCTLLNITCQLDDLSPLSVKSAVLLRKAGRQETAAGPDFVVFDIPDETVVGYGLDFRGYYRHLPYIAALEQHEISPHAGIAVSSGDLVSPITTTT